MSRFVRFGLAIAFAPFTAACGSGDHASGRDAGPDGASPATDASSAPDSDASATGAADSHLDTAASEDAAKDGDAATDVAAGESDGPIEAGRARDAGGPDASPATPDAADASSGPLVPARVSAGTLQTCVAFDTGGLKCWGQNWAYFFGFTGQPNLGVSPSQMGDNLPLIPMGAGRRVVSVRSGDGEVCAILDDGSLKCLDQYGSITAQPSVGDAPPTIDFGTGRTVKQVALGARFACALLDNATVKCWGDNSDGQLGIGNTARRAYTALGDGVPAIDFGAGRTVKAIDAAGPHVCAVFDDDAIRCWGFDNDVTLIAGSLGDQAGEMTTLPKIDLGTGHTAKAIAIGNTHACAILESDDIKCWGNNLYGQLGLGDTNARGDNPGEMGDALPIVKVGTGRKVASVAVGFEHTCALLDDGTVKCWGRNRFAQLGQLDSTVQIGDDPTETGDGIPVVSLGTGRTVRQLSTTGTSYHNCVLLDDHSVKCWGDNSSGELGLGDTTSRGDMPGQMGDTLPPVQL